MTAHALRRTLQGDVDSFPQDVMELMAYFRPAQPGQRVQAVPGAGLEVPLWILGSSTYGAQLAAALGLPYAFASHFAPDAMEQAVAIYRERFRPSGHIERPHVMLGVNVHAAPTDAEARLLFSSHQQAFVNLRSGRPGKLPAPKEGFYESLDPYARNMIDHSLSCTVVGGPEAVRRGLRDFVARTGADELMVTGQIHDPAARRRSFAIAMEAATEMAVAA